MRRLDIMGYLSTRRIHFIPWIWLALGSPFIRRSRGFETVPNRRFRGFRTVPNGRSRGFESTYTHAHKHIHKHTRICTHTKEKWGEWMSKWMRREKIYERREREREIWRRARCAGHKLVSRVEEKPKGRWSLVNLKLYDILKIQHREKCTRPISTESPRGCVCVFSLSLPHSHTHWDEQR